ncbi:hypothetical protein GCM10009789_12710 [Kribbella sancticallisti]|uniref:Septum formation n=1 Tax=Kribbella sancticallisti TaxID=460087 RepID=A0ABN2CNS9_9ACTN
MEPTPPPTGPVGSPGPGNAGPGPSPAQGSQAYPYPGQPPYPPAQGGPPPGGQPPGGYPPGGQPPGGQPPGGYPPGQGFQPYPGGNQPPRRKTSMLAILAFIFGLIAFVPVAVVLGIIALVKIPKNGEKGQALAVAGIVLSGLWLAGIVGAAALSEGGEPDRDATGQVTTTQNVQSNKLRVGDCVTEIKEGEFIDNMKIQPCNQPNGGKVFAVFDLPAGKWPGLDSVKASAEKGCTDRYKASKQQAETPSDIWFLHPTENSWALGDHNTTCLIAPK